MKQDLYEELVERKNNGEKLEWNNITKNELETLFEKRTDNMIADLYGVTKSQVTSKRKKWNIKLYNYAINKTVSNFLNESSNKKIFEGLNQNSKERLLNKDNIDIISIALTNYLFRKGPVEDMHSEGKLSQKDMKTLNKFMVNRVAGLLKTMHNEDWLKLELLLNFYSHFGLDWDKPVPDTEEIDTIFFNEI